MPHPWTCTGWSDSSEHCRPLPQGGACPRPHQLRRDPLEQAGTLPPLGDEPRITRGDRHPSAWPRRRKKDMQGVQLRPRSCSLRSRYHNPRMAEILRNSIRNLRGPQTRSLQLSQLKSLRSVSSVSPLPKCSSTSFLILS